MKIKNNYSNWFYFFNLVKKYNFCFDFNFQLNKNLISSYKAKDKKIELSFKIGNKNIKKSYLVKFYFVF